MLLSTESIKKSINMWHRHWLECTWQWHIIMLLWELNLQHNNQHYFFAIWLRISTFKLVLHACPPSTEINNITQHRSSAADKQDEVALKKSSQHEQANAPERHYPTIELSAAPQVTHVGTQQSKHQWQEITIYQKTRLTSIHLNRFSEPVCLKQKHQCPQEHLFLL